MPWSLFSVRASYQQMLRRIGCGGDRFSSRPYTCKQTMFEKNEAPKT